MAFPYTPSLPGISQLADQLRKKFPETVDAGTLKQLEIAPNNESYLLNIYKFLGILTPENTRSESGHNVFLKGDDEFQEAFSELIKQAYSPLFELHGDQGWTLDGNKLLSYFRNKDKTSQLTGKRQTDTFVRLAEIAGKRGSKESKPRASQAPKEKRVPSASMSRSRSKPKDDKAVDVQVADGSSSKADNASSHNSGLSTGVALAVRIEVNLPASSDQSVYDAIFRSIRENLIEGA